MYNKNCSKKMFGEKSYPALRRNLMNSVVFKNMGGKMTEDYIFMLLFCPG